MIRTVLSISGFVFAVTYIVTDQYAEFFLLGMVYYENLYYL